MPFISKTCSPWKLDLHGLPVKLECIPVIYNKRWYSDKKMKIKKRSLWGQNHKQCHSRQRHYITEQMYQRRAALQALLTLTSLLLSNGSCSRFSVSTIRTLLNTSTCSFPSGFCPPPAEEGKGVTTSPVVAAASASRRPFFRRPLLRWLLSSPVSGSKRKWKEQLCSCDSQSSAEHPENVLIISLKLVKG